MTTLSSPTAPQKRKMEIQRALIDKDFDQYVLSTENMTNRLATLALNAPVLEPLDATQTLRKAQWLARIHHNALVADPFLSEEEADGKSVAYFVNENFELMQLTCTKAEGLSVEKLYQFPVCVDRQENVSLQVAGRGLIIYCDGCGVLSFLKSDGVPSSPNWNMVYECSPVGSAPTLLLGASFDENTLRFHTLVAEVIDGSDTNAVFRLHAVDMFTAITSDSMDIDNGAVGLEYSVTELVVVSSLPSYVSFVGPELLLLAEGTVQTMIQVLDSKEVVPSVSGTNSSVAHKRHHDEDELDDTEMDELLSKIPRAGIGYHGDISNVKSTHELGLDTAIPLEERFQKSTTPFSSLDEPLHSAPDVAARRLSQQGDHHGQYPFEVPTADSILSGYEECDDSDPNAKACLLLINLHQLVIQDKLDIECRNFRFLCSSARSKSAKGIMDFTLLFQNDVHALVYAVDINVGHISLSHTTTLPAFGFVQASKQEKKYMTFHPSGSFACIGEFEKRMFIYHGTCTETEKQQHTRKQNVVEIGRQPLLGLRIVGNNTILCLTPQQVYTVAVPI